MTTITTAVSNLPYMHELRYLRCIASYVVSVYNYIASYNL